MSSILTNKIKSALAKSSSHAHVLDTTLFSLGKKTDVIAAIQSLIDSGIIFSCRLTKAGHTYDVYWLGSHLTNSKHHFDTLNPAQKILASENKFTLIPKKAATNRECKLCLVIKPLSAFINGSRRCNQCIRALRLEKYRLSVLAKAAVKKRWCMSCKKKHPVTEFKSAQSRRCIAALLAHEQNKTAYNTQKNKEWREKAKAAKAASVKPSAD